MDPRLHGDDTIGDCCFRDVDCHVALAAVRTPRNDILFISH